MELEKEGLTGRELTTALVSKWDTMEEEARAPYVATSKEDRKRRDDAIAVIMARPESELEDPLEFLELDDIEVEVVCNSVKAILNVRALAVTMPDGTTMKGNMTEA